MQRVIFCGLSEQEGYSFNLTSLAHLALHITAAHTGCLGLLKIVTLRPTVMVHAPGPARHPEEVVVAHVGGQHPHYTTLVKAIPGPLLNNRHH